MTGSIAHPLISFIAARTIRACCKGGKFLQNFLGKRSFPLESFAFLWKENFREALLPWKKIFPEGPFWAF
jgi:hypothetical protein